MTAGLSASDEELFPEDSEGRRVCQVKPDEEGVHGQAPLRGVREEPGPAISTVNPANARTSSKLTCESGTRWSKKSQYSLYAYRILACQYKSLTDVPESRTTGT